MINSRQSQPLWVLPDRVVEPETISRMYVGAEQDCGPKPLDDPAAKQLMDRPDCIDNTKYYSNIATKSSTENPIWVDFLPREVNGRIKLTQPLAIDLALLHSRDYQTEFERVYLSALNLSGNRFEFDTQWLGGNGLGFTSTGADLGNTRDLDVTLNRLGFQRNLAGGGQFATQLLNSLTWDFGSGGIQNGSASLVTTFTQPLLRGAFRHVRLEDLTQAERDLLYNVRDFARFRRLFYVDVASSYLSLLAQTQAIRNSETNVENLRQNLTEFDFYVQLRTATQIQRDQVFQQYQNGRLSLLAAQQDFATSLDQFRFQLGLPAWVPVEIDESLLKQFDLANDELLELQDTAQELFVSLMEYLPPNAASRETLLKSCDDYQQLRERVAAVLPEIENEFRSWQQRLDDVALETLGTDDRLDFEQQRSLAERIESQLVEAAELLDKRKSDYETLVDLVNQLYDEQDKISTEVNNEAAASPSSVTKNSSNASSTNSDSATDNNSATDSESARERRAESVPALPQDIDLEDLLAREKTPPQDLAWQAVQNAVGNQLRSEVVELYLMQTQIRLYLIEINALPAIKSETAITYAFANRLDLKNSKASVVDAFRKVEVAADALESDLSLTGGIAIGSDPTSNSPFRFDSSSNRYTAGVQFDGPLNRLNERNAYRATQISYQRASRDFMASKDLVANELRSILRQLELSRLNFQIARQQVVAATRQVDEAQINLRSGAESESVTLFLLQALQGILDAKNNLIGNWIAYRVQKMQLFAALEILYVDENGQWINEDTDLGELLSFEMIDPEYFPISTLDSGELGSYDKDSDYDNSAIDAAEEVPSPTPEPGESTRKMDEEVDYRAGIIVPSVPINFDFGRGAGNEVE